MARVLGFEPVESSHRQLVAKYAGNPQVKIVRAALADTDGPVTFYMGNDMPTVSSPPSAPASTRRWRPSRCPHGPRRLCETDVLNGLLARLSSQRRWLSGEESKPSTNDVDSGH